MASRLSKNLTMVAWLLGSLLWTNVSLATVLNVPQEYQEQSQWCWAASSQAVLAYYRTQKTQTEIAQYGTDGVNTYNWLAGSTTNPTRNGINLILLHFANLATTHWWNYLSQAQAQSEIDARRPLVIYWAWDQSIGGGGHFVVAKGIDGDYLTIMDPGVGPTISTYSWVRQGSSHTWTDTLTPNQSGPANITAAIDLLLGN
jgi:ABC-type bacteriocin/lantibiotic exporter with double-glycine peptidase domain